MLRPVLALAAATALPAGPGLATLDDPADGQLPPPARKGGRSLEEALQVRRSVRSYSARALPLAVVTQLLWAAQGVTAEGGLRTAPSAGALYPLQLHLLAVRVDGLVPGVYRYRPGAHRLERTQSQATLAGLTAAAQQQQAVAQAAAVVMVTASEQRTAQRYGARAARFVAFEAGAAAQNLALQAAALRVGNVAIGAFDELAVAQLLRLPPGELPIVLLPLGVA